MKGKKIKQINNLVIFRDDAEKINYFGTVIENPNYNKCSVWTQDGRCLEDRMTLEQAEEFCRCTMLFTGLKDVLKTFDEHGWKGSFTRGLWTIGNGGYDCWFELYYKGLPVARCIAGELESNVPWVNYSEKEKMFNKILEVYDHLKVSEQKPSLDSVITSCEDVSKKGDLNNSQKFVDIGER